MSICAWRSISLCAARRAICTRTKNQLTDREHDREKDESFPQRGNDQGVGKAAV